MRFKPLVLVLALALLHTSNARADVRAEVESDLHEEMERLNSARVEVLVEYGKCRKTLARAKKKLKPTAKLKSFNFGTHPKAVQDGDQWTITVADIPWICDAVDLLIARGTLWTQLESAKNYQTMLAGDLPLDANARINAGDYDLKGSKTCAAAVAKEKANGATEIKWKDASVAIADAEALCDVLAKWGEHLNASGEANFEKVAPKYRELGIDGDRLRLFVEYDDVSFRGKKCAIIEDLPALAKAKYVYQWLENSDGTHTIRKYTFKKNKYKVSEKTYKTEAKAYKGCK
jgi:hypothetical protein